MISSVAENFFIQAGLVALNHASYGAPTRGTLAVAERHRAQIERDPSLAFRDTLRDQLTQSTRLTADLLAVDSGQLALSQNATSGAAAIIHSLPLSRKDVVAVLDTEYASVRRAWQVRAEEVGAAYAVVKVPLPLAKAADLIDALNAARIARRPVILQASLVTSSAALALPMPDLARWADAHNARLIIDAAHCPGHVAFDDVQRFAEASFGTLHKWLPVPRAVGFVWATDELAESIRPAEVSLSWDEPAFDRRFFWPGTFDPAPRLCVADALEQWATWEASGEIHRAADLADLATVMLERVGLIPTAGPALRPPRLRAFLVPGLAREALADALEDAGIRAWTGTTPSGETLLRIATHVYNDEGDIDRLLSTIRALITR